MTETYIIHAPRHKTNSQISSSFQNRSFYAITLPADPCDFQTYDLNKDGEISKEEFDAVLGVQDESDALFTELDALTGLRL